MNFLKNCLLKVIVQVSFVLLAGGCLSVPDSPNPRFYMLQPQGQDQLTQKFDIPSEVIIGIGPVEIPEYLNRPQIVTFNKDSTVRFSEFDRWAESLDFLLAGVVRANLSLMLSGAKFEIYPWNAVMPVKYQVMLEVVQLNAHLDNELVFVVQWSIFDIKNKRIVLIKRSEFRQEINPHNYSTLVEKLSFECGILSSQIAEAIAGLEIKKD
jgi:hypothetical protein